MTPASDLGPGAIVPPSVIETVRLRWENIPFEPENFIGYVGQRNLELSRLSKDLGADLYLAFACCHQLNGAIETFHRTYGGRIAAIGRRFGESQSFADELTQRVFEKLFVRHTDKEPGISQYRAEAPLSAWVNSVARRIAFRQVKSARPERLLNEELLAQEISDVCDQELQLLREQQLELLVADIGDLLRK